jgi:hypothetical protein
MAIYTPASKPKNTFGHEDRYSFQYEFRKGRHAVKSPLFPGYAFEDEQCIVFYKRSSWFFSTESKEIAVVPVSLVTGEHDHWALMFGYRSESGY